jgi:hypothetical protein
MIEIELFKQKAANGYTVCYAEQCPKKGQCLRWKVGQQMPDTTKEFNCVNPKYAGVGTDECESYKCSERVRFAKGMKRLFNDDMPKKVVDFVRQAIIRKHCQTYYYEYRKGERLIPPALQEYIRKAFREIGWDKDVEFDSYIEEYEW